MERKFIHEYAIGYLNSFSAMVTAQQLMSDGQMNSTQEEQLSKCHIYFICARPNFILLTGQLIMKIIISQERLDTELMVQKKI